MKAAFFAGPNRVEVREVAEPRPAAGDILVEVRGCGICGSDLHFFHGETPAPRQCPGHEIAGEVAAVGEGVDPQMRGRRVAIEPLVVCGRCRHCRTGNRQLCGKLVLIGFTRPGGFAERVCVPSYSAFALPDDLDDATAALTEPTAVAVHAARLARIGLGDRVLVLGAGSIGLLAVLAARAAGAAEVAATARYPHQAEMAELLGAGRVFAAHDEGAADFMDYVRERPPDVVIETVGGQADTLATAVRQVRAGGTVVVLGVFSSAPRLPATALLVKEVRLIGSMTYDRVAPRADFEVALDLLVANLPAVRRLITHRVALASIQEAFRVASDKGSGAVKVMVTP